MAHVLNDARCCWAVVDQGSKGPTVGSIRGLEQGQAYPAREEHVCEFTPAQRYAQPHPHRHLLAHLTRQGLMHKTMCPNFLIIAVNAIITAFYHETTGGDSLSTPFDSAVLRGRGVRGDIRRTTI